jgi:hypothetical protein
MKRPTAVHRHADAVQKTREAEPGAEPIAVILDATRALR